VRIIIGWKALTRRAATPFGSASIVNEPSQSMMESLERVRDDKERRKK
jgi:hypothetical protein